MWGGCKLPSAKVNRAKPFGSIQGVGRPSDYDGADWSNAGNGQSPLARRLVFC